jgi:putative spermidine/putrescine transport system permease protein
MRVAKRQICVNELPVSTDRIPLKQKLRRSARRSRLNAVALTLPLLAFTLITFVVPIGNLLLRSFHDPVVANTFPDTLATLRAWDGREAPDEPVFAALAQEIGAARRSLTLGKAASSLNFELAGLRTLLTDSARRLDQVVAGPFKPALIAIDKRWGDPTTWAAIRNTGQRFTSRFYLASADLRLDNEGRVVMVAPERQIYVDLYLRTLWVSVTITGLCLLFGYPVAYLLASLPQRRSNLLMIIVMLPFWTSLLVRTTAWIVILRREGPINQFLIWLGLISPDHPLSLVYNQTGTIIAMTQILLPFMILPIYSVMRGVSPDYMRAAQSLGAGPIRSFLTVYLPSTMPGLGAGSLLVFIIAMGYYITPALVGGRTGQLISNFIAYHMQTSLDWGFAGALSGVLLAGVVSIYVAYDHFVGVDRLKLG